MRNKTIDIMRGICISLVVLAHAIGEIDYGGIKYNAITSITYSFFVLALFIISGYLSYGKASTPSWLAKKIKRFIIPLIFFGVIYFYWHKVFPLGNVVFPEKFISYAVYCINNGFNGTLLWFLWDLLLCYCMAFLFDNIISLSNKIPVWAVGIAAITLLQFMPATMLGFNVVKWYSMFFIIGYCIKAYEFGKIKNLMYISLVGFPIAGYLTDWMRSYQNEIYYYMGYGNAYNIVSQGEWSYLFAAIGMALLGTMFVWSISQLLSKVKVVSSILANIGKASIGIYLLHLFFIQFVDNYWLSAIIATALSVIAYLLLIRNKYTAMLIGAPSGS